MKQILIFPVLLAIIGCAGSPAAISGMSSQEIRTVSDDRLCNTYAATHGFINRRTPVVIQEVRRRSIDCSAYVESAAIRAGAPSMTEFGLRTMTESSPQPGATVGPSLGGAIGRAGVGTLNRSTYGPGDPVYDRLHPTTSVVRPTLGEPGGYTIYTYPPSAY